MFDAAAPAGDDDNERAMPPPDALAKISNIPVTPEMMAAAAALVAQMPDGEREDFDLRMIAFFALFEDANARRRSALAAVAIDMRLRALSRALQATFMPDCDIDSETHCARISQAALRAACDEPLQRNETGAACFDIAHFQRRLLH